MDDVDDDVTDEDVRLGLKGHGGDGVADSGGANAEDATSEG